MSEDEDWSDSDSEAGSEVETSVLLGVPDGFIETPSDAKDAAVSRIGGVPVWSSPCLSMCILNIECAYICRHFSLRLSHPLSQVIVNTAKVPWSCSCRCGVRSRTARMTERCTSGDVR